MFRSYSSVHLQEVSFSGKRWKFHSFKEKKERPPLPVLPVCQLTVTAAMLTLQPDDNYTLKGKITRHRRAIPGLIVGTVNTMS